MSAAQQRRTIGADAALEGIGLASGRTCRLVFRPAPVGGGIVFRRVDLPGSPEVRAEVRHAVQVERRTQLGDGVAALHTVEHVLAAVAAHGIDDLVIEMDAPEPPILDGSAQPFFEALRRAGIAEQGGAVQYLRVRAPVTVTEGESRYEAFPAETLRLEISIDFPHAVIGRQSLALEVDASSFERELARARTFGFVHEVEALRKMGLIQGASTANAVVLDGTGPVDTTLRWPDEFVRHKAMDCVGDLALAGRRVRARIVAHKPSHRGTVALVRALVDLAAKETQMLGIEEIMRVLPHRYPFLLVDRILELEAKRVVGIKNVTINEPFFQGHFPGPPDHARRADHRGDGAGGRRAADGHGGGSAEQGRVLHVPRQRAVAAAGEAGRPAALRGGPPADARACGADARRGQGRGRHGVRGGHERDGHGPMTARIHPTAIVSSDARLGADVEIGAFAIVGPHCVVGDGSVLAPRATLERHVTLGAGVRVGASSVIGGDPQDLKYKGEPTTVEIGDGTVIREFVTVNRGTTESMKTTVGKHSPRRERDSREAPG